MKNSFDQFEGLVPLPEDLAQGKHATLSRRKARAWGLVLEARHIPFQITKRGMGWQILVTGSDLDQSLKELRQYEKENREWPPAPPQGTPLIDNRTTTVWVLIALGVFYNITQHQPLRISPQAIDWYALGNAHADKIISGQWWRLVTALTLHADWQHLLGNLLIGGVFISRLSRDLKSGTAWLLILTSGAVGNLINAWLQNPDHRAVGASTAIFGTVGILAAISMVRYRKNLRPRRRWTLPVAAALGLLAMLGVGGENTDLGAHLFGFMAGLPLGLSTELLIEKYGRPSPLINLSLALLAVIIIAGSWMIALYSS
jgi:membrane associated rhomboid family serine protease